jgi:isopentenyl-diphosphate delta-isomerase
MVTLVSEKLIIVDENDNQIRTGEKLKIHQQGILHRCFSIFVFNSEGNLLLQKRSRSKYHSGGLWTNTCCSHPRDGEDIT